MLRTFPLVGGAILCLAALLLVGCTTSSSPTSPVPPKEPVKTSVESVPEAKKTSSAGEEHGHKSGEHGGIIVSLGRDSFHVEAIVTSAGELRLYMLGNDESRVIDIEAQDLIAYVKAEGNSDSTSIEINPQPQPGDAEGKASLFIAKLPESLVGKSIDVTVPNITIAGERFRLGFTNKATGHGSEPIPGKVVDEAETKLYLTPGGLYTVADIKANGNLTASQKFVGFQPSHDLKPKVGDKICPVTLTKANPKCTWIVGGQTYEFCCPPCVDEFVALAKTKPEQVKQPGEYVRSEASTDSSGK